MPVFFPAIRFLLALICGSATFAWAQSGTIRGRVVDATGAAAAGAQAMLISPNQTVIDHGVSGADGTFSLRAPGRAAFTILVTKPGFASQRAVLSSGEAEVLFRLAIAPIPSSVVVTAEAGLAEAAGESLQSVNSISRGQIEQRGVASLAEIFKEEPGLDVQRTAPWMGGVSVRGLLGRNVAVYRDGIRYTTSAQRGGVSTFFNLQDPTSVEAVEALRGPNSAQYGSDSLGGAVHLLSRVAPLGKPGLHGEFSPVYSSASHAFGGNALAAFGGSRYGVTLNVSSRRVNTLRPGQGIDTRSAVTRFLGLPSTIVGDRLDGSAFSQYGAALHAQYAPSPHSQLILHYERGQQDGARRPDQLLGGDGNLIADVRNLMLDFGYIRLTQFGAGPFHEVSGALSYNAQREERVNQGGRGDPLGNITHQYERMAVWGTTLSASRRFARHTLVFGGDGYREAIRAPAFTVRPATGLAAPSRPRVPDGAVYRTYGAYVQDSMELTRDGRLRATGAVRFGGAGYRSRSDALFPEDSMSVRALTSRAGIAWRAAGPLLLHATYARGFRAPSMTDLGTIGIQGNGFFETSVASVAGRDGTIGDRSDDRAVSTGSPVAPLRPETSDNYEAGFRLTFARLRTSLTGFAFRWNDAIVSRTLILPPGAAGQPLGDQIIARQLASGAVFVPIATAPVLVRGNIGGARMRGVEHSLEWKVTSTWTFANDFTWLYARDAGTGLPPDIEGGVPPAMAHARVRWTPLRSRFWVEGYSTLAGRQERLSSLALADRRTGASRSRGDIADFFGNGARVRGLTADGVLRATGENLAQVQQRVLGGAESAPMFGAVAGYLLLGVRGAWQVGERSVVAVSLDNLLDRSHRGVSWGTDGPGRDVTVRYRIDF